MKNTDYHTKITIFCKDGSIRIVTVEGRWEEGGATKLGKDLEGDNYWQSNVVIQ